MSEKRRDDGNPYRPSREALIDRQIREAMEDGAFDELPFQGERIPLEDDSAAGEWALAHRMLRNAGVAPPWIETDKEIRELLAWRDAILVRAPNSSALSRPRDRAELARLVEAANRAIVRLNSEAPTERQHRRLLDPDRELEALERVYEAHG